MQETFNMTDSDLLLEVARMVHPKIKWILHTHEDDLSFRVLNASYSKEFAFDPNTIHPLWAEYADKYWNLIYETNDSIDSYMACYQASLTLRGMLEAVWTVLKEAK